MLKTLLPVLLLCSIFCFSQNFNPADRDDTFNDFNLSSNHHFISSVKQLKVLPNGKYFALNSSEIVLMDGNDRDPSFNTGAGFLLTDYSPTLNGFEMLPDGKLLVFGRFDLYNGQANRFIVRLNADGTTDATFSFPTATVSFPGEIIATQTQADGKILVLSDNPVLSSATNLYRLNSNGTVDNSFVVPTGYWFNNVILQADGKILVSCEPPSSSTYDKVVRLNPNGSLDSSFAMASFFNFVGESVIIYRLKIQPDGKLLVGGSFRGCNSVVSRSLVRLNTDGTLDTGFSPGQTWTFGHVRDISLLPDGKMYVGGRTELLVKLNANGSIDETFSIATVGGYANMTTLYTVDAFPDGKVLVGGDVNHDLRAFSSVVFKANADGTRDSSFHNFDKGFFTEYSVNVAEMTSDGKILVGGNFHTYNNTSVYTLLRLNTDGTIDSSMNYGGGQGFGGSTPVPWSSISRIAALPDGKFYISGALGQYNGLSNGNIIRLNPDGSHDTVFNSGSGFDSGFANPGYPKCIITRPDGGILAAGTMSKYKNLDCGSLAHLSATGTMVASYFWDGHVTSLRYLPDGKLLVGLSRHGNQYSLGGMTRLNANMTGDNTFALDPQLGEATVDHFEVQQDGRIIIAGDFVVNGTTYGLARILPNGALDPTFNLWISGADDMQVHDILLMPDEKVLVSFSDDDNVARFVRLNNNGLLDETFEQQVTYVKQLNLMAGNKVLLVGPELYQGEHVGGLTRIVGENYHYLQGENKLDLNQDGCDVSDAAFPQLKLHVTGGDTPFDFVANTTGLFRMGVSEGNYTATPLFENPTYFSSSPQSITMQFPGEASPVMQDFCIVPTGVYPDLEIFMIPTNAARPGQNATYKIICRNKGNQIESGSVNLVFDDAIMNILTANPAVSTQSVNNLSWNFSNLQPFAQQEFLVTMKMNTPLQTPPVTLGTILDYTVAATSAIGEETPIDNTSNLTQTVVSAFDPNDKICLEGSTIDVSRVGEYVHYMIRFENTGNYQAENIKIIDIINTDKYDIATLVPISGSGQFITRTYDGNRVEFFFENINLPFEPSSNDGYVAFKIKTKSTLIEGDIFSNFASIYFDYNEAIVTAPAATLVTAPLGVDSVANDQPAIIFPNPVDAVFNIILPEDKVLSSISIFNTLGQLVIVIPKAGNQRMIDVSSLAAGSYILKIESIEGSLTGRFIKQ